MNELELREVLAAAGGGSPACCSIDGGWIELYCQSCGGGGGGGGGSNDGSGSYRCRTPCTVSAGGGGGGGGNAGARTQRGVGGGRGGSPACCGIDGGGSYCCGSKGRPLKITALSASLDGSGASGGGRDTRKLSQVHKVLVATQSSGHVAKAAENHPIPRSRLCWLNPAGWFDLREMSSANVVEQANADAKVRLIAHDCRRVRPAVSLGDMSYVALDVGVSAKFLIPCATVSSMVLQRLSKSITIASAHVQF